MNPILAQGLMTAVLLIIGYILASAVVKTIVEEWWTKKIEFETIKLEAAAKANDAISEKVLDRIIQEALKPKEDKFS